MNRLGYLLIPLLVVSIVQASETTLIVCDDVREPKSLNPFVQWGAKSYTLLLQIFEGLTRLDEDGNVEPCLAKSWRCIDPLTVEFTLQEQIRFSNGNELSAEDVAFCIQHYLDPKTGFPARGFYQNIVSVNVKTKKTVEVKTRAPDGILMRKLALLCIAPRSVLVEKGDGQFGRQPIGAGAFRLVDWKKGHSIALERNPFYWRKGFPRLDKLVFRFLPVSEQTAALLSGKIDLLTDVPGTSTFKLVNSGEIELLKRFCFVTYPASFNNRIYPFELREARMALNLSINRKDMVKYEARGNGRVLATVTMPGEFGHNPHLTPYEYSPVRAKKIFKKLLARKPFRIKALVKAQAKRIGAFVKASLQEMGVPMDITYSSDATEIELVSGNTWDIHIGVCPNPICHSSFIMGLAVFSGSPIGLTNSKEFDQKYVEAMSTLDLDKQRELLYALDKLMYEENLALFTYQKLRIHAFRRGLVFKPHISAMHYFFDTHWK